MSSPPSAARSDGRHPLIAVVAIALGSLSVVVSEFTGAVVLGEPNAVPLVRMHSECLTGDVCRPDPGR